MQAHTVEANLLMNAHTGKSKKFDQGEHDLRQTFWCRRTRVKRNVLMKAHTKKQTFDIDARE